MEAVNVLRDEHHGVLVVLEQLRRAAAAAEAGVAVPAAIFQDIREYFVVFVDRCHHTKEEEAVFPRLLQHGGNADLVDELEQGHDRGRKLSASYAEAVGAYVPGDQRSGRRLAAASREYAAFLQEHIEAEAADLFPHMEAMLSSEDEAMVREFDRIEEEQIGPGTHERLHGMIEELAGRLDQSLH
jgi:hemerythrin-like domain-containing protein